MLCFMFCNPGNIQRLAPAGIGHMKFLSLSPCESKSEEPLIATVSAEDMPEDPDDYSDQVGAKHYAAKSDAAKREAAKREAAKRDAA
jgi:hypothetical protein